MPVILARWPGRAGLPEPPRVGTLCRDTSQALQGA